MAMAETDTFASAFGGNNIVNYASPNSGVSGSSDATGAPATATSSASTAMPGVELTTGSASSSGNMWLLIGGVAVVGFAAWYFWKHHKHIASAARA